MRGRGPRSQSCPPGSPVPRGHTEHFHHASAPALRIPFRPPIRGVVPRRRPQLITPGLATSRQRPASLPKFPVTPPSASGASRPRSHPPARDTRWRSGLRDLREPRQQEDFGTPPGPGSGLRGRRPRPTPPSGRARRPGPRTPPGPGARVPPSGARANRPRPTSWEVVEEGAGGRPAAPPSARAHWLRPRGAPRPERSLIGRRDS